MPPTRLRLPPASAPAHVQAAQRGQKAAGATAPEADDPLAHRYGDAEMVQSAVQTDRVWTDVAALGPELVGKPVLVRARVHTVRGKGKSAFLVLRQATATAQAVLFVDDATVSRGLVKYASALPRESIVDVEGSLAAPQAPVEGCSQSQASAGMAGCCAAGRGERRCCRHASTVLTGLLLPLPFYPARPQLRLLHPTTHNPPAGGAARDGHLVRVARRAAAL